MAGFFILRKAARVLAFIFFLCKIRYYISYIFYKNMVTKSKKIKKEKEESKNFAVIETGGKQYLVSPGQKLKIEKIKKPEGQLPVIFDKVLLLVKGGVIKLGVPRLEGIEIKAEWVAEKKDRKITNVRYKSKTRRSRKQGHRQIHTEVVIGDF